MNPMERYRLLNGQWPDGTSMRPAGDGYDEDDGLSTTKFMYNGDPRDTSSWSANNELDKGYDVSSISSVSLGRLNPGSVLDGISGIYCFTTIALQTILDKLPECLKTLIQYKRSI